ncbi:MAG: M24 family metallopeptidase, partial [Promethearchaeota archaeon]
KEQWTWEETDDPFEKLNNSLSTEIRTIGLDPKTTFNIYHKLQKTMPERKFVDAGNIISDLRSIKDEEEVKNLKKSSQKTGDIIINILNELEVGVSEIEIQQRLISQLKSDPTENAWASVQFGENSAIPHYSASARELKTNDIVLIDAGTTYNDYWGDITITCVFGQATEKFKKIFNIVLTANQKAKEAIAKNEIPAIIDKTTRDYISSNGFGKYFTHRTGHGMGLEVHEEPYIVENNEIPLKIGNVFTIEPGIYLSGKFGVRAEDNIIKTEGGFWSTLFPREELIEL